MSDTQANPDDSDPCEFLAWDSEFFNMRIARVKAETLTPQRVADIDEWSRRENIACLYFMSGVDDPRTTQLAEKNGYRLTDVRLTFERSLENFQPDTAKFTAIENAAQADLPELRKLARISHTNTRFYFDGRFPRSLCDDLYDRWITVAVEGQAQAVFVARTPETGEVAGYVTCHGGGGIAHRADRCQRIRRPERLGKPPGTAGHGVVDGKSPCGNFRRHAGRNIAAQRLYQRLGFRTRSLYLAYHKWYVPPEG